MTNQPFTTTKDLNVLLKKCYQQGWTGKRGKKHIKLFSPDGNNIVVISISSKNRRGLQNAKNRLNKYGVDL